MTLQVQPIPPPSTRHHSPIVTAFPGKGATVGFPEAAEALQTFTILGTVRAGQPA